MQVHPVIHQHMRNSPGTPVTSANPQRAYLFTPKPSHAHRIMRTTFGALGVSALLALTTQSVESQATTDWPNLQKYAMANSQLRPKAPDEQRVVFMGNSITEAWATHFTELFPGKPYVGRGISGQTTPQMLLRFRQDVIALKPAVVVILGGTNDIAGNTGPSTLEMIEDNIASMSELAQANGIRVVLCSVLPVFDYPWKPGIAASAEDHRAEHVDSYVRRIASRGVR